MFKATSPGFMCIANGNANNCNDKAGIFFCTPMIYFTPVGEKDIKYLTSPNVRLGV